MLPITNGKIDTETIADLIVTHILAESMVKYYDTRLPVKEKRKLEEYVKEKLDTIIQETSIRFVSENCQ